MKTFSARFSPAIATLLLAASSVAAAGGEPHGGLPGTAKVQATPPMQPRVAQAPIPYHAQYSVVRSGATIAEASFTLSHSRQGWEFRTHARPSGMVSLFIDTEISEYSLLEIDGTSVRPLRYQYRQEADKDRDDKTLEAQYDWQAGMVTVTDGSQTRQLRIDPGTHDPLSAQLALMQCIKSSCGKTDYAVLDDMKLQQRRFKRAGTETVRTALGVFETVKLSYHHGKRETVTWLAPELNHIPVRIRQYRNSKLKSEMRITAVDFK